MADFVAVLKKTLDGLAEATPQMRERVYEKARATIAAKLAAMDPPPPASIVERQKRSLEDAITTVEQGYAAPASSDPLEQLENVFASLRNPQPRAMPRPPAAKVDLPSRPTPPAAAATVPAASQAPPPIAADPPSVADEDPETLVDDEPETMAPSAAVFEPRPKRGYGGLIAAAAVLIAIAGGGYGVWQNRDAFSDLLGFDIFKTVASAPAKVKPAKPAAAPAKPTTAKPAPDEAKAAAPAASDSAAAPAPVEEKYTQRLAADGTEIDAGPAGGEAGLGEGTSVAALTQPATALAPIAPAPTGAVPADMPPAAPAPGDPAPADAAAATAPDAPAAAPPADAPAEPPAAAAPAGPPAPATTAEQPAVAVGQKAIFYEERTNTSEGSAEPGSIVWSLVQELPGGDLPPEPAIRAEATIPGRDLQLRMTIRRNADQTLPASHIIEIIFLTPDGFEGGGIDNVLRVSMKSSEQEPGSPLIGIPAKIADGFFLVALNDTKAEIDANMTLLRRQSWIDVPVIYKSGRRALFTMEKGIPGEKVFDEALKAWQVASAG